MPDVRKAQYQEQYGLSAYDAELLITERDIADYFETAAALTAYPKLLANLMTGELFRLLPPDETAIPLEPAHLAGLATLVGEETINNNTAKRVLKMLFAHDEDPAALVEREGLAQINDEALLAPIVAEVLATNVKSVADYRAGKTAASKALIGQAMAKTGGKANPQLLNALVQRALDAPAE